MPMNSQEQLEVNRRNAEDLQRRLDEIRATSIRADEERKAASERKPESQAEINRRNAEEIQRRSDEIKAAALRASLRQRDEQYAEHCKEFDRLLGKKKDQPQEPPLDLWGIDARKQ